jgi:hypothetical protein
MSINKQQTAVDKLEAFLRRHCNPSVCNIEWNDFNTAFLEFKEIQKDQHIKSWEAGLMKVDFNEYYNETYGGGEQ